jgi:hypothetical protein
MNGQETVFRFPEGIRFFFLHPFQAGSRAQTASSIIGIENYFPGGQTGRDI